MSDMRQSDTYLAILDEGRIDQAKRMVLLMGGKRFGAPSEAAKAALDAMKDLEQLERLGEQLLDATSWQQLLGNLPR
jgi:hypothetical protein